MANRHEKRLERIRAGLEEAGIDTLLVTTGENRRYLSGFSGEDGGVNESAGALFITRDKLLLSTDSRYTLQAHDEAGLYEIHQVTKGLAQEMPVLLKQLNTRRLGFEAQRLPHGDYCKIAERLKDEGPAVEMIAVDEWLGDLRVRKENTEIDIMRRALALSEDIFAEFLDRDFKTGITEKQAAWLLEKRMREAGAEGMAFPVIAAFGENSARPHAVCGERRLADGQPVLFDWGARLEGYCADISRSFMKGQADDTYRKVHWTVYEAQQMAIAAVKPGATASEVDAVARQHIERAGFKDKFGHGLGHGVGLAVHEPPRVSPPSKAILEEGMVFTVEPAIYLPGWGGVRIENMVVVRADGAEVLNRSDGKIPEHV